MALTGTETLQVLGQSASGIPASAPFQTTTAAIAALAGGGGPNPIESFITAASDETTTVTTGTAKVTFRMPYAFTLTEIPRLGLTTAATGATLMTVDINQNGASILSTKLTTDAGAKTSTTASTPAVLNTTALANDASMTVDFVAVGNTIAGTGVKVTLIGRRT